MAENFVLVWLLNRRCDPPKGLVYFDRTTRQIDGYEGEHGIHDLSPYFDVLVFLRQDAEFIAEGAVIKTGDVISLA